MGHAGPGGWCLMKAYGWDLAAGRGGVGLEMGRAAHLPQSFLSFCVAVGAACFCIYMSDLLMLFPSLPGFAE